MSKAGRNDPCVCGSGRKYKQCCLRQPDSAAVGPEVVPAARLFQAALELHQSGRLVEADGLYEEVLRSEPRHADALHMRGAGMTQRGDCDSALALIDRAIAIRPAVADYHNSRGLTLQALGRLADAEQAYRRALALRTDAIALNNLGNVLQAQGETDAAIDCYRRAIALQPALADAHNHLGHLLLVKDRLDEAAASYRRALALKPAAGTHNNLGQVLQAQGDIEGALAQYRQGMALEPDNAELFSNYLMAAQYRPGYSTAELIADHRTYADRFEAPLRSGWPLHDTRDSARAPRIGFVSGDFCEHPVGFFLESALTELAGLGLDIVLYPTHDRADELTARLRKLGFGWRPLFGLDDTAAFERIRGDGIDVLVDLSGHTAKNRLPLFARKPAPLQVGWLGYWATTGLQAIDYILCDRHGIPAGELDQFVEQPWYLPDTRLCFTPPRAAIEAGPLPALANDCITFGCCNNLSKLNAAVIELWSQVLHGVPGSRLLLKSRQLDDADVRAAMSARFGAHDIAPERLLFEGHSPRADYFAAYQRIDIALDPFPFTGGTTSVECLWMGVPLITRKGDRLVAHQGESILHNVGMADWIAADDAAYVALAAARAADIQALAALRAQLRGRLLASPLCDAPSFARNLATALREMWRQRTDAAAAAHGVSAR